MRIHIGESDKMAWKVVHEAIVEMLRKEKFAGATVYGGWADSVPRAFTTTIKYCACRKIADCGGRVESTGRASGKFVRA